VTTENGRPHERRDERRARRFIVFGAGAIGGVVGARLHQTGHDVQLIARGAHHDAVASRGLTLEGPSGPERLQIPVAPSVADAGLRDDDVVLLAVKSQDTVGALEAIAAVRPQGVPIVCLQNGVHNELAALRLFPDVYGAVIVAPTVHLEPGVVQVYSTGVMGAVDLGRYPSGVDAVAIATRDALRRAGFEATAHEDVMPLKYDKLIGNLANVVQALCESDHERVTELAEAEGREVLERAGIRWDRDYLNGVRGRMRDWGLAPIGGQMPMGGSTWQSVTRGSGQVETDYLNGEIVLLGRSIGMQTPVNRQLQEAMREAVHEGRRPGWVTAQDLLDRIAADRSAV
jgi:2-dehydropantoate 2-reductase